MGSFDKLRELVTNDIKHQLEAIKAKAQTDEGLNYVVQWDLSRKAPFKGTLEQQRNKAIKAVENKYNIILDNKLTLINQVEAAPDFTGEFIITVEWKKSRMWGMNPRAYTNYGFEGESIGGCGYDKLSTATAEALNSNKSILKRLWLKKAIWLQEHEGQEFTEEIKREYLGYGCGYQSLPKFEGGVGVSSHQRIIAGLGLIWKNITSTTNTDVFLIMKGGPDHEKRNR